jgi:hypothetical protein
MHRTQIYFEETLFEELKKQANLLGLSISAYIRDTLKKDLEEKSREPQALDFSKFSGMWENREIDQRSLRKKAWK